ncbi:17502_t:CDS:1, partial [Acaulospora morrowiae]
TFRGFDKEVLSFSFNTLSYFSENHRDLVKGSVNDLEPLGKINNLADPYLRIIDESVESCEEFSKRFSEFLEFFNSGIMDIEELLQKIENKMDETIYERMLEQKKISMNGI